MADATVKLTIHLFGAPEARLAGAPLVLHHQKARALLYYLAATGRPHTRDHLATLLWSESPESNARHSLRSSLYRIRQALHDQGAGEVLVGDGDLVYLRLDDDASDIALFHRFLKQGSESALAEAASLYRGPLLQGFAVADAPLFEEWVRFEESELRQAYLSTLQRLAAWAEHRHAWNEAIVWVQHLVLVDPLSEEAQQRLISLYVRTGAIGQALHQYRQFETELGQELGLRPSSKTQALLSTALRARRGTTSRAKKETRVSVHTPQALPFTGRDSLLEKLLAISRDPIAGQGVTVLLQGEDGIGKSRLLEELISALVGGSPPWIILQGSCSPFDDLLSYGPFLEAFQSAQPGDLTDLLSAPREGAPGEPGQFPWRVLQALRLLARHTPLLLTLDDLHWANNATLHLFCSLATRLRNLPLMLVGTVQRSETISDLQRLVTLGRRRGDFHLFSLSPLTLEDVMSLTSVLGIDPASGHWADTTLAVWLYERSGGSPFILTEIIAQLQAEAILTPSGDGLRLDVGRWLRWRAPYTLPETTHDLVTWRLADLAPTARSLLDMLAIANQPLPFVLLRDLPGFQDDQLLPAIEDLVARGLLIETATDIFGLPHNLLQEALIHSISHVRRQVIHRQLAGILDSCPLLQQEFPLRQIALHAVAGKDIERARRLGLQVLDELAQDNANAQTADFLHQLYDLLAPTASMVEMLRLTSALGQVHQSLGQPEQATFWHHQRLELANKLADPSAQATAHFALSELALVANNYLAAEATARAGLAIDIPTEDARRIAFLALGHRLLGASLAMEGSDLPAAERHLQEAVAAHRHIDNTSDLCATLFELGNVAAQRGELRRALELYQEAAHAAEAAHVHYFLALAHNNFAYHSLLLGQLEAAQGALAKGKKLAETYEMFGALLHLNSTEGEIHLYLGEWAAASEIFQRGLVLAEELGNLERQAGYRAGLALVARGQNDLEGARTLLAEALTLITARGYWHLQARVRLWLAETLLIRGHISEAASHLDAALETARAHDRRLLLLQGERLHARLLAMRNDWQGANALFANTLKRASSLDFPLEIARTRAAWGESALLYGPGSHQAHTLLAEARNTLAAFDARAELQTIPVGTGAV